MGSHTDTKTFTDYKMFLLLLILEVPQQVWLVRNRQKIKQLKIKETKKDKKDKKKKTEKSSPSKFSNHILYMTLIKKEMEEGNEFVWNKVILQYCFIVATVFLGADGKIRSAHEEWRRAGLCAMYQR